MKYNLPFAEMFLDDIKAGIKTQTRRPVTIDDISPAGIFRCRYGSRGFEVRSGNIKLEIVSTRLERLHDISESDKLAEGATTERPFGTIWSEVYKSYNHCWENNPWVWVIEFNYLGMTQ